MSKGPSMVAVAAAAFFALFVLLFVVGSIADPGSVSVDVPIVEAAIKLEPPPLEPFAPPPVTLDSLEDRDSRFVNVDFDDVTVHQCEASAVDATGCAPGFGVPQAADLYIELRRVIDIGARGVDCGAVPCVLAAASPEGQLVARIPLVFGGPAPKPVLEVVSGGVLERGEVVQVRLSGFPPATSGSVAICVETSRQRPASCDSESAVPFLASGLGVAEVEIVADCERARPCAVGVIDSAVVAPYTVLQFATPDGASLSGGRVAGGVVAFAVLLLGAVVLVRRTNWTPPGGDPFLGVSWGPDPFAGINLDEDD